MDYQKRLKKIKGYYKKWKEKRNEFFVEKELDEIEIIWKREEEILDTM